MRGPQRRQQLIEVGRTLFAQRGFDGTSMEEIAAQAGVSKPVVYEHFGDKSGVYAAVVEQELVGLERVIRESLTRGRAKKRVETAVIALLTYIEQDTEGFQILVRDASKGNGSTYATLLNTAVEELSHILAANFERNKLDASTAILYGQALVGMVSMTAQWWLDNRDVDKSTVAAHIVNLCWNGLAALEAEPELSDHTQKVIEVLEKEGI